MIFFLFLKKTLYVALADAICVICPNPPEDRFTKVAPLGNPLLFLQTEERKDQFLQVLLAWCKSWEVEKSNEVFRTPLIVTPGAPGDGKTHFEWTLADRKNFRGVLDQELKSALDMFEHATARIANGVVLGAALKDAFAFELSGSARALLIVFGRRLV